MKQFCYVFFFCLIAFAPCFKTKPRLSLTVATGVPVAVANEATETPPIVADKISKVWST